MRLGEGGEMLRRKPRPSGRRLGFAASQAAVLSFVFLWLGMAGPASAQSFRGLGDIRPFGYNSSASGVSDDGTVVVGTGTSIPAGQQAFRWTKTGGMQGIGDLPGGDFRSSAQDVSANGSVIVGTGGSATGNEAFRWTS